MRRRRNGSTTWVLRLTVVACAVAAYVWMLPSAFGLESTSSSSSYSYSDGYPYAYGTARVPICHFGMTLFVASPAVPAHLAHGDRLGPCR